MRLRGLEIQGFKSFPDKTKLTFHDGITAVVGPNGSGKSNIVDAVRWVLGEQSSKTLRGGKMEDVIFGGTQNRRAQGYAQVQLLIDNSDRTLPYDKDELIVSRKLYRSGESEYRIGGDSVRLRDVHELFMDTGLGRDGYSIIGQGRIAEIMSAKSTQRREIFEEAAGISKYRFRRHEAQRKLEQAEENLLRLQDILVELEARVGPLKEQSEKAAKFLEYAGEKKTLEISLWVLELDKLRQQMREHEDKFLISQTNLNEIQSELADLESQIEACYQKMQEFAIALDGHRELIRELEAKNAKSGEEIAVMRNDMLHNTAQIERIEQELLQSSETDQSLDEKIQGYEREAAGKEQLVADLEARRETLTLELEQERAQQDRCRAQVETLKERRFGLTQSLSEVRLSAASSTSLIDETIERLKLLSEGANVKNENETRIRGELHDCKELLQSIDEKLQGLTNERSGYNMKLQSRQEKVEQIQDTCRKTEDEIRACAQRAALLRDMENSFEGFAHSVKFIMSRAENGGLSGILGPVSRLVSVDAKYAVAVEIALGAGAQNIVVSDERAAEKAIMALKAEKAGRATFLPITTIRGERLSKPSWLEKMDGYVGVAAELVTSDSKYSGIIDQLLGRIVVVQTLEHAIDIAKRGGYRFRVVTLDGQVVNTGGSMTGGHVSQKSGILSRASEIESLQKKEADLKTVFSQHQDSLKTAQEEFSAIQALILGIDGELKTAQEDRIHAAAQEQHLTSAAQEAAAAREAAVQEYETLTSRLEEMKAQSVTNEQLEQDLSRQLEEVAEKLAGLADERDALSGQIQEKADMLAQQDVEMAAVRQEIDGIFQMKAQLLEQKRDRGEHIRAQQQDKERLALQNEELARKIAQAEQDVQADAQRIETLNSEIVSLNGQRSGQEAQTAQLRAKERETTALRENAAREQARLEERKNILQTDFDGILTKLWDEYELTRSQAEEAAEPLEDQLAATKRLGELKSKIKALGNVNVGAVEEYREVSERYTFLKEQVEDAGNARQELLRLIDDLTVEMRTLFAESFYQIGKHFSRIFVELFGGGKGELTLTDPADVLESGIDIHVQPPGKLIKNLAALSGGEQAFVAIAIYFAILKVRPSPICFMDEIEAALDENNVVKYAQYLRNMCEKTQFIAITHRRGTMEEADVLYGVTMQEEGVSKLLELNVKEVEERFGITGAPAITRT